MSTTQTTRPSHSEQVIANREAGKSFVTSTTERPLEFRLKTSKTGKLGARYYDFRQMRSFPIALAAVRAMESEGRAVEVPVLFGDPGCI